MLQLAFLPCTDNNRAHGGGGGKKAPRESRAEMSTECKQCESSPSATPTRLLMWLATMFGVATELLDGAP